MLSHSSPNFKSLGFSIAIGSVLYSIADPHNASSETTCNGSLDFYVTLPFVPLFALCLIILNQGRPRQWPVMLIISFTGYVVNHFASQGRFRGNTQVSSVLTACFIGIAANLYSRFGSRLETAMRFLSKRLKRKKPGMNPPPTRLSVKLIVSPADAEAQNSAEKAGTSSDVRVAYGLAIANMLPAIWLLVPSGLAAQGALLSGITAADQIAHNTTGTTIPIGSSTSITNDTSFAIAGSVVEIALGITVGLLLSTLLVYPLGMRGKRSALFTF